MLSILVCDHDQASLDHFSTLAGAHPTPQPFTLYAFANCGQALGLMKSGTPPDIAFLAYDMPDMPGARLAETLRSSDFEGPIIFLWSEAMAPGTDCAAVNAYAHLQKPVDATQLQKLLGHIMLDASLTRQARITLHTRRQVQQVLVRDIVYAEKHTHSLHLYLVGDQVAVVEQDTHRVLERFSRDDRFAALNSRHIVNMEHVAALMEREVLLTTGEQLPLPRMGGDFYQRWNEYHGEPRAPQPE